MDAKKCDFCGNFFVPNNRYGNTIRIDSGHRWERLDICPDCLYAIVGMVSEEDRRNALYKVFLPGAKTGHAGDEKV